MKTKILKYAADGNTIVRPYADLMPYSEKWNIFSYDWTENYYSQECKKTSLVLKLGETYFQVGEYDANYFHERIFGQLEALDSVEAITNYIYNSFPNTMLLEVARENGLDVDRMLKTREAAINARREAEAQKQRERDDYTKKEQEKELKRLQEQLKVFTEGEKISSADFVELCKIHSVSIHPRTAGMLGKRRIKIGHSQASIFDKRPINLDALFDVAKELLKKAS